LKQNYEKTILPLFKKTGDKVLPRVREVYLVVKKNSPLDRKPER